MRVLRINPTFSVIVTIVLLMDQGLADTVEYDGWEIIWQDTFSKGLNIDETWNIETGDSWQYGFGMWGNNEKQFYTKDSVRVTHDGVLKITASYVDDGSLENACWDECYQRCVGVGKIPDTEDFSYCMEGCGNTGNRCSNVGKVGIKSGRLNTKGPVPGPSDEYPVVRIEARVRMSEMGLGLWPAFWMLPWVSGSRAPGEGEYGIWPLSGEIDIMESANQFDFVNGSIHFGGSVEDGKNEQYSVATSLNQSMAEEYHTFGFQWHRGLMRWYTNDTFYGKVSRSKWWTMADLENEYAPFDTRFSLILNLAVGGIYPEYNAGRQISVEELQNTLKEPKSMYIDRVTVWGLPKK